jgi:hypothetical protein
MSMERDMNLLVEPPELAEWWTVNQAIAWLDLDRKTVEQIIDAIRPNHDDEPLLCQVWGSLDFCAQAALADGMSSFDAESMDD